MRGIYLDGSIQPEGEELDLVRHFCAGDPEAFRRLMAHYEPRIFAFLLKMLGDRENTQDVLQETLITIFQELPAWKPGLTGITGHPLAPWIYRIATNKALSLLRKQAVRERYQGQSKRNSKYGGQARASELIFPAQEQMSMEERSIARELLRIALLRLKTDEVICLIAHFIDGERYEETAKRLGLSSEAVRKRTQRALIALRKVSKELGLEAS